MEAMVTQMETTATGFALFRLPHTSECTLLEGSIQALDACSALNGRTGFVVAPFQLSADEPIVLIRPERSEQLPVAALEASHWERLARHLRAEGSPAASSESSSREGQRQRYAVDFANFHAHLQSGEFQKIVLARCSSQPVVESLTPLELFRRACNSYPRLYIALLFTPQSGLWLMATPEILLEGGGSQWRTIALAGTIQLSDAQLSVDVPAVDWSVKNIQEQRYVATYVTECLEKFTKDFREEGPRTARAANLVHLRSDFSFTLSDNQHIGDLLQALHPTPAVCGLPKRDAFRFIVQNEHTPRRYYSGFVGMLAPEAGTHLFVSLRCMQFSGSTYRLYAGGGLLKDSVEELEWNETEAKLGTMRRLISL